MKIEKVYLTKEILFKMQSIDNKFYINDMTSIEWYLERYNEKHYAYCLFDDDIIVGYIVSVPIKKELYDTITNGVILNDLHINPEMFINESNYYYIVSCVIEEEYRYKNYGKLLIETLLYDLKNCNVCCLTISKEGYKLTNNYLNLKKKLNDTVSVFEK